MKSCRRPLTAKLARKIAGLKIRNEKDHGAARDDFVQVIAGRAPDPCRAGRLEKENLANDTQRMGPAFLRRNEKLDPIAEKKQADLVVVPDCAEGEQAGDFGREFALRLRVAAEIAGCADVHDQHDGQFPLFGELLDESGSEPRRYVPIDRADLVAGLILADLLEVHPAALEDAVVIARENSLDETLGLDFERADFS